MLLSRRLLSGLTILALAVFAACGPAADDGAGSETDSAAADTTAPAETASAASPAPSGADDGTRRAASGDRPAEEPEPAPAGGERLTLPEGLQMTATLDDSLDTEELEAGTAFTATVDEPVVQDPYVAVPAGSRVYGRVTQVRQPEGEQPGLIRLAMDSIRVREAASPLAAEITDTELATRGEMKDEAEKIGGGAAAGALIGAIVGKDVKGAVIGAAAGAAAGTAVALGTQARYGVLPKGSRLTLRLTGPLEVAAPE